MRKILGKSIVLFFMLVGMCIMFSNVVIADPSIVSVVTDPANPKPESTVTVIANITGDGISSVYLTVSECIAEGESVACFEWQTVKMSNNSNNGLYEATFNLIDKLGRTNHIKYNFTVISNGISYEFKDDSFRADLDTGSGNNNNNNAGEKEKNKGIPGFETILMLIALVIGVILFKQKRSR